MSGGSQQPFDFTFPSLAPGQAPAGSGGAGQSQPANPFGVSSSRAPAGPQQQQQPPVQLQQPVQPASLQPLTARSTVVHATSRAPAPQSQQQQDPQQRQAAPKPVPITQVQAEGRRNKVPLEKGFSQVAWLKLTKSGADLTGGAGRRRDITLEEVRQHRTEEDAWMVLHGKVYNITPYLRYHPGGADILMKAAGKDGTSLFNKYHPWVNAAALLEKCLVGLLHKPEGGAAAADGEQQQQSKSIKSKLTSLFK